MLTYDKRVGGTRGSWHDCVIYNASSTVEVYVHKIQNFTSVVISGVVHGHVLCPLPSGSPLHSCRDVCPLVSSCLAHVRIFRAVFYLDCGSAIDFGSEITATCFVRASFYQLRRISSSFGRTRRRISEVEFVFLRPFLGPGFVVVYSSPFVCRGFRRCFPTRFC